MANLMYIDEPKKQGKYGKDVKLYPNPRPRRKTASEKVQSARRLF